MAIKSQTMMLTDGTNNFFFKGSIALYEPALATKLGLIKATTTKAVALVTPGELLRSGLCVKVQVRTEVTGTPGVTSKTTPVLCHIDVVGEALAWLNGGTAVLQTKKVLGANIKRDKHYA